MGQCAGHYNPTGGSLSRGSDQLLERISLSLSPSAKNPFREEEWWLLKGTAAMAPQAHGGLVNPLAKGSGYFIPHSQASVKLLSASLARGLPFAAT